MRRLNIVFMGTPEFAVASLDALYNSNHKVSAVVTVADKPAGRGQQIQMSAVKKYAVEHTISVLQPVRLKDESFLQELQSYQADIFVIVAFRMLPEVVWSMPPMGSINLHGSLLPKYRGAAPINWAIIQGEKQTGVTVFFLQHEIDTGKIVKRKVIPISSEDTAGSLHDRMMAIGAETLLEAINELAKGQLDSISQDTLIAEGEQIVHAPKIFKEDCKIDWTNSMENVDRFVRGLSPYPAAWTMLRDKTLKVFAGKLVSDSIIDGPWKTDGKTYLHFACADGTYSITELQLEGKKKMSTEEFLRGWK